MSDENTPHDAYFKASIRKVDVARDLFQADLPQKILNLLDLSQLELRPESFVDKKLKKHLADVLYQTLTRDGKSAYVYILTEHQSYGQKILPFRLLKYMILAMEEHLNRYETDQLPIVIPLVVYNGEVKYPYSMNWLDLFEEHAELAKELYSNPFALVDLTQLPDDAMRGHYRAGLMEWCLKNQARARVMQSLNTLIAILDQWIVYENEEYLLQTIRYMVYNLDSEDVDVFINTVKNHLPQPVAENMMTIAERLEQRGIQRGFLEGEIQTLLEQMEYKFDSVPETYRARIKSADQQHLRMWIRNILKADTLDEVFKETKH